MRLGPGLIDYMPASTAPSPAATVTCAKCHVAQDDGTRPHYPLWFESAQHEPLCPGCVPMKVLSPTVSLVFGAQAIPATNRLAPLHTK